MVVLFISDTALVRRLARNVVNQDFTDAQIIFEQKAAYAKIGTATGKFDWSNTNPPPNGDPRFANVAKIEEQLAAKYILEHYGAGTPEELNWIAYWDTQVKDGLKEIIEEGVDVEADADILTAASDYGSYPASLIDDPTFGYMTGFPMPYRSTTTVL
jgi:hypothetical protein